MDGILFDFAMAASIREIYDLSIDVASNLARLMVRDDSAMKIIWGKSAAVYFSNLGLNISRNPSGKRWRDRAINLSHNGPSNSAAFVSTSCGYFLR